MTAFDDLKRGDPGPPTDRVAFACRTCWGDQQIWYGNAWGMDHTAGRLQDCRCPCHEDEVYLA